MEYALDLSAVGATPLIYIDVSGRNVCSITAKMIRGADFDGGEISVKRSNTKTGPNTITNLTTPVVITAAGLTELQSSHWVSAKYLVLQVTGAAGSAVDVALEVVLKQLNFTLD